MIAFLLSLGIIVGIQAWITFLNFVFSYVVDQRRGGDFKFDFWVSTVVCWVGLALFSLGLHIGEYAVKVVG